MRARSLLALAVATVALVAGCTDDDASPPVATTTTPTTTVPAPSTTAATTTTTPAATIVLRPDGLDLVDFGDPKDPVISVLSTVLGTIDETGVGCELGGPGTTTARWEELRVEFAPDGTLRAYNLRPPPGTSPVLDLRTEAGIGLGSTVAELQAAYGPRLAIPGLGPEFGGMDFRVTFPGTDRVLLGALTDTSPTGAVTSIFTEVCE